MSLKSIARLVAVVLLIVGAIVSVTTAAPVKFVGIGAGLVGLLGFLVLAFVGGGGDPDKQAGSGPPPLRWGG